MKKKFSFNSQSGSKKAELNEFLNQLKIAKMRVTAPRVSVLQTFLSGHGPFTVEEVFERVIAGQVSCDLATIYRILGSFEKIGVLRRCDFGDGNARFELSEKDDHHHHHVICRVCRRVEVLEDCELPELNRFAGKSGFVEISHSLEFFGVCPSCKRKGEIVI